MTPESCHFYGIFIGFINIGLMSGPVGDCPYCCERSPALDIHYMLFTRQNPTSHEVIKSGDVEGLAKSKFNMSNPTVIYLMGFSELANGISAVTMRKAYLSNGNYNFIVVDWSRIIAFPWYIESVRNTRYMGQELASFVRFLDECGARAADLHVIGFSLGAEAAGFAGKRLTAAGMTLGRITGLDPAFPGYSLTNKNDHLSKGDAKFVDVIHTNPGIFGFPDPIGDLDIYPNFGHWVQPGCWIDQLIRNNEFAYFYGCSHIRAWRYYAESVGNPGGFPATSCADWRSATRKCDFKTEALMGIAAKPPMAGKMYLQTNMKPPFAKNGP